MCCRTASEMCLYPHTAAPETYSVPAETEERMHFWRLCAYKYPVIRSFCLLCAKPVSGLNPVKLPVQK